MLIFNLYKYAFIKDTEQWFEGTQ